MKFSNLINEKRHRYPVSPAAFLTIVHACKLWILYMKISGFVTFALIFRNLKGGYYLLDMRLAQTCGHASFGLSEKFSSPIAPFPSHAFPKYKFQWHNAQGRGHGLVIRYGQIGKCSVVPTSEAHTLCVSLGK